MILKKEEEVFSEETHDYLKRNSLFNKKKSELFLEFQNKVLELEKKWHIQKTSFFTKYSFSKKTFDNELEKINNLKNSPFSYKNKLNEITTRLEKAKEEYRKNITLSAENYNQAVKEFQLKRNNFNVKVNEEKFLLEKRKKTILSMKKTLERKEEDLNATKKQFELESEIQLNELESEKEKTITIRQRIEKEKSDLIRLVLNIEVNNYEEAEKLLELDGKYTFDDLKKNYKKLALKYHPDTKNNSNAIDIYFTKHMFQQVNKSYSILKEKFIF